MTKKEIVKSISDEIGLTQLKTKEIVQKTFDAIIETLVADHRIELRNFGVFRSEETGRARRVTHAPASESMWRRNGWLRSSPARRWRNAFANWSKKRPTRRPAEPQGLPHRQNRHITLNFLRPNAD